MIKLNQSLLIIGVIVPAIALAQPHPMSGKEPTCDHSSGTHSQIMKCLNKKLAYYSDALNVTYTKLLSLVSGNDKGTLMATQKWWINYMNSECKFVGSTANGGQVQTLLEANCKVRETKERYEELNGYVHNWGAMHKKGMHQTTMPGHIGH